MANIIPMENVDGVYGAFFRRKLTITDIDDIISNLRITILDLGIDSDQISRYKLQINTEEIDLLFERKYKSNNGNSIFGIIGPLLIIVLILGNIINLENLNIGDTAKWIMSPLIAIIGVAITAFGKELFQFDEQKIFDKLFRKYNKK